MSSPSDLELTRAICSLLNGLNREEVSVKSFLSILSERFPNWDIKARKSFIKETLIEQIHKEDEQLLNQQSAQHVKTEQQSDSETSASDEEPREDGQEKPKKVSTVLLEMRPLPCRLVFPMSFLAQTDC